MSEQTGSTGSTSGCDACRKAIADVRQDDKFVIDKEVETAFEPKFDYFMAIFKTCRACGATWLNGASDLRVE